MAKPKVTRTERESGMVSAESTEARIMQGSVTWSTTLESSFSKELSTRLVALST